MWRPRCVCSRFLRRYKRDRANEKYDCISDIDTKQVPVTGSKQYQYSIDFDNVVEGQAQWMETLLNDQDPIMRLIFTDELSGSENDDDDTAIPTDDRFFVVQRNDGDCEAQLGEVAVTMSLGLMASHVIAADIAEVTGIDVALGAALGLILGPEGFAEAAIAIGAVVGGIQSLEEAGVLDGPSAAFHHKRHTERFSACKPAYVKGNWSNSSHRQYLRAAFEGMRERIKLNKDVMCTSGGWLHNRWSTACFMDALKEGDSDTAEETWNFDWYQLLRKGNIQECDREDRNGVPSEGEMCGKYRYETQLGPIDLGFNKLKRNENRARYGLMGPPDDHWGGKYLNCENVADRYCDDGGPFKGNNIEDVRSNGSPLCKQSVMVRCKNDPDSKFANFRMMPDEYYPEVEITKMDKPCIFEQPATFFTTFNPYSPFGQTGKPTWMGEGGEKPNPNKLTPFEGGDTLQMKDIFGNNDDRCFELSDKDIEVGCSSDDVEDVCNGRDYIATEIAECKRVMCCGGYTTDDRIMWTTDDGNRAEWENPDKYGTKRENQNYKDTDNKFYGYPSIQQKLCYRDLDRLRLMKSLIFHQLRYGRACGDETTTHLPCDPK